MSEEKRKVYDVEIKTKGGRNLFLGVSAVAESKQEAMAIVIEVIDLWGGWLSITDEMAEPGMLRASSLEYFVLMDGGRLDDSDGDVGRTISNI